MPEFVKAMGILMLAVGVLFSAKPTAIKAVIAFAKEGKNCYYGAILRLILGGLLLLSAWYVAYPFVVGALGLLGLASGALIFVIGKARTLAILDRFLLLPEKYLRFYAVFAAALGVMLIYSA